MLNVSEPGFLSGTDAVAVLTGYWSISERLENEQIAMVEMRSASAMAPEAADRSLPSDADEIDRLLTSITQGFCVVEVMFDEQSRATDYLFLQVNRAFEAQTGLTDAVGNTMRALRPAHEAHWFEIYGEVALTGVPARFERQAAALGRWYDVYAFRVGSPEQRRVAILFNDITDRKKRDDFLEIRADEGDHRAKNILTLLTAMVRMTRADTVEEYQQKLLGRINALVNSQRVLSSGAEQGVDLRELVENELAAHTVLGENGSTARGPAVELPSKVAQCLAMVFYELATNGVKYGALSVATGSVLVEWEWRNDEFLELRWLETGGPRVAAPAQYGVGTRVMTRTVRDQLGGSVSFDWPAEGLRCSLVIPMPRRAKPKPH
jgi:two-component system, chemotaxis family, CheB/CheR fusion protein